MPLNLTDYVFISPDTGLPVWVEFPSAADIAALKPSNPQDMAIIHRLSALLNLTTPADLRKAEVKYLERFNITPSNPIYKQQLQRLSEESQSNKVMIATARRNTERAQTLVALTVTGARELMYVNEGPDPCEACLPLNGETGTLQYFENNNIRPGDQCLGGDNCLCQLWPISRSNG
jgi:hypothetical protein